MTPPTAPARVLGRYALYGEIASGGMATVHLGRLLATAGFTRTVAIKRLHPHYAKDPEFVSMFLDEARLAARIRHPNVTATLDVVALEGELFLVMDYIEGETLSRLLKREQTIGRRTPPPIAASILVGVLHGLHAAHEATSERGEPLDLVHRDVSPQNVLVGTDGVARVLDFGIAKAGSRVQSTRDGVLKGKLAYMAPDQLRGQVSRATDIYSASIVLWEMLAGRQLYQGLLEAEVYAKIMAGDIEPPSTHAPDLAPELEAIAMRGLAREPSVRWPTARDMARALERTSRLAPASEVGDWVERLAKPTLIRRAELVAGIERDLDTRPAADDAGDDVATRVRDPSTMLRGPDERVQDVITVSSGSITRPDMVERKLKTGRYAVTAALLLAGVGAFAAFSAGGGSSRPEDPGPSPSAPPVAPSAPVETAPPSQPASSIAAPAPSAAAVPVPAKDPPAKSTAPAKGGAPRRTPPPAPPKSTASAADAQCNPPYTLDAVGDKIYKRECLR